MIDANDIKTEPQRELHESSITEKGGMARRDWTELTFILLQPVFLPLPVLNVMAEILAVYALLSLAARRKLPLALSASVIALGLGSIIRIGSTPPEFNLALLTMSLVPTLALALGFRMFKQMRSAFLLMSLVAIITVGIIYALGAEAIAGIFDEFMELAKSDEALNATIFSKVLETLRWLTPALIATQALLPVLLAWYLAPTLERVFSSGKSAELATSSRFYWLTLTQWRMPQYSLGLLFVFAAGRLVSDNLDLETSKQVADNLLFIAALVFAITGFSMVEYVFRRFRVSWIMRGSFYFLALVSALPGTIFLAAVGLADTQFDLRKRISDLVEKKTEH